MKKRILLVTMLLLVSTVEANYGERSNLRKDYTSVYDLVTSSQFEEAESNFMFF